MSVVNHVVPLSYKHEVEPQFPTTAYQLNVTMVANPPGPVITAAQTLTLACLVDGGTGVYYHQWSGDCSGGCFVTNQTSHSVVRDALHSVDSGIYSCAVTDDAGNTGNDSATISVRGMSSKESNCYRRGQTLYYADFFHPSGAGLFVGGGVGQVSNSSIVVVNSDHSVFVLCLSGTSTPDVGHWINPNGTDITNETNEQFDVVVGDSNNPGSLEIQIQSESAQIDEGVYSCAIPDDTAEIQYLYVAIYQYAIIGKYLLYTSMLKCGQHLLEV